MQIYHDSSTNLDLLTRCPIAAIGYGNQGRAQALNLRDSDLGGIERTTAGLSGEVKPNLCSDAKTGDYEL